MSWTEAELNRTKAGRAALSKKTVSNKRPTAKVSMQQLGRLKQGQMNKTEAKYAEHLEMLKNTGKVIWYKFEGVRLKLAKATMYNPDFSVLTSSNEFELHEVKGYWEDDAKVKIKVASELYPFRFVAIHAVSKSKGGGWKEVDY